MYNRELAQYSKRKVLLGLAGRLSDRVSLRVMVKYHKQLMEALDSLKNKKEVESFMQTEPNWRSVVNYFEQKGELLEGLVKNANKKRVLDILQSVPNWKEILWYSQDVDMPVAVIEEIENKEAVEAYIKSVPGWRPIVHYFSQNPDLQDKYPVLTNERLLSFLYQHHIGYVVCSLTDHETDRFVCQFRNTSIAQRLAGRNKIEDDLLKAGGCIMVTDYPEMFHFLTEERLKELKTLFYEELSNKRAQGKTGYEMREMQLFIHYMVESLDGRNLRSLNEEADLTLGIAVESVNHNMRESETVNKIKKLPSAVLKKQELKNDVQEAVELIEQGVFNMVPKEGCGQIRSGVEKMREILPDIKRLHHKVQQNMYMYVRKAVCLLEGQTVLPNIKSNLARFYLETADTLKEMIRSNGEQALWRRQAKIQERNEQEWADNAVEMQARLRQKRKEEAHRRQQADNIERLNARTPEEIAQALNEREERQKRNKLRKIFKNKLKVLGAKSDSVETEDTVMANPPKEVPVVAETQEQNAGEREAMIVHRFKKIGNVDLCELVQKAYPKKPFYVDLLSSPRKIAAVGKFVGHQKSKRKGKPRSRER